MDLSILLPTVQGALEKKIFTQVSALGVGINNSTLKAIVSRVAEEVSHYSVQLVSQKSNQSLTEIPKNRIGVNNPVNIVNQNNNATSITNNFWGLVDVQVNAQITGKIATSLERELKKALPGGSKLVNYGALAATITQSLTPTVSTVVNSVVKTFTTSLFSTNSLIPVIVTGKGLENSIQKIASNPSSALSGVVQGAGTDGTLNNLFGEVNAMGKALYKEIDKLNVINGLDSALEPVNKQYAQAQAGAALRDAQNFDINNTDNQEKLATTNVGFNDPQGVYPTKEYAGKSDTNKLAQGDARGTVVLDKNEGRMLGAKLPFGGSWDEPESAYNAQYPYNKVTQTESGHIIEIDDTPGNERIHLFHKSGTYVEIDVNGSVVKRTKGSSYEIIDRNGKIAINGRADISINGACNIYVGNDANLEVEGDVNVKCYNDVTVQAGGTLNLGATEEINITSTNINLQAHENFNIMADKNLNLHAGVDFNLLANATVYMEAVDAHQTYTNSYISTDVAHMKAAQNYNMETGTDINLKAGGTLNANGESDINVLAGASVNIDGGSAAYINSGNATGAEAAKSSNAATIANISNLGLIDGRKDTIYFEIDDPSPLTLADGISIHVETDNHTDTKEMRRTQRETVLATGVCSPEEYDRTPVATDSDNPTCSQRSHVAANEELKRSTILPGNYNLSPHFTLDMVTSKTAVSANPLEANRGLSYGEIAYNLQALALNVLEPIKKLYPNMFVTSSFRPDKGQQSTSQHGLGQAADIQFRGASKSDYYEIARKLATVVNYDQLLLEYRNSASNPWIHISYSGPKNRNAVMTLNNDKVHSQGLVNLA